MNEELNINRKEREMRHYKAIIDDETAPKSQRNSAIGNTKSPGSYKGMTAEQLYKACKDTTIYRIKIVEI